VVLYPDVAPFIDSRFDCRDLLRRSVIHYEAERKASSAIISAPIQGVMTGTVASISRGPSEDRSSGLVSTQAGASILDPLGGGVAPRVNPTHSFPPRCCRQSPCVGSKCQLLANDQTYEVSDLAQTPL
jgi:hypothetical protein